MIKQGVGEHKQPTFKKLEVPGGREAPKYPWNRNSEGVGGGRRKKTFMVGGGGGGMDIFWNYTNTRKDFWRSLFFSCFSSFMEYHSTALLFQLFERG